MSAVHSLVSRTSSIDFTERRLVRIAYHVFKMYSSQFHQMSHEKKIELRQKTDSHISIVVHRCSIYFYSLHYCAGPYGPLKWCHPV